MLPILNETERRVLGALLEKALAQPQYYPMTLAALVAACNQKSNRDPVMDVDEDTVWQTLDALRERNLVTRLLPGMSGRVDRFKHTVKDALGWERAQQAVMAELLLRGPQTVGELRTRCNRMVAFENTESVSAVLDTLAGAEEPIVATLPRGAGQSAVRYTHCLYPDDERPAPTPAGPGPAPSVTAGTEGETPASLTTAPQAPAEDAALRDQLDELQAEVAELHQEIAGLRWRLDVLEQQR